MNYEETGPGTHIRDRSIHVLQPFAGVTGFGASVGGSAVPVSYGYGGSYMGNSYGYGGGYGYNGYVGTIIVPIESQRHYMRETWKAYGLGHDGRGYGGRNGGNGHQGGQGGSYGYGGRGNGGHQGGGHQGGGSYGYGGR